MTTTDTLSKVSYSLLLFLKKDPILPVSGVLALLSMLLVPPDAEYAGYVDFRVLALLFCLMCVVNGFSKIGLFQYLAAAVLGRTRSLRQLAGVLTGLCFFGSMAVTNDVALLTFVPFAVLVVHSVRQEKLLIPIIVLQTIAANLGSMLTPVGNPQNLFLYQLSGMGPAEFLSCMLPYTLASLALLCIALLFLPNGRVVFTPDFSGFPSFQKKELFLCTALFLWCMGCVARLIPWQLMLPVVLILLLIWDGRIVRQADYGLLCTFVFFFIFIGNMGRIPAVSRLLEQLLSGRELFVSAAASQVISNVPAAILLSGFTQNYPALLAGVNIGGLGTLIASLASLISYKQYAQTPGAQRGRYLLLFTLLNLAFLLPLLLLGAFLTR